MMFYVCFKGFWGCFRHKISRMSSKQAEKATEKQAQKLADIILLLLSYAFLMFLFISSLIYMFCLLGMISFCSFCGFCGFFQVSDHQRLMIWELPRPFLQSHGLLVVYPIGLQMAMGQNLLGTFLGMTRPSVVYFKRLKWDVHRGYRGFDP